MLPWASIPKRFDRRAFRSEERHTGAPRTGGLRVSAPRRGHVRPFCPEVPPSPSRCVGPSVAPLLDDRAALRCDVPLHVASRCAVSLRAEAHPVAETVQQVPSGCPQWGYLLDYDHSAKCGRVQSTVPGRRSASGPDILLVRDAAGFCVAVGETAPQITRPLGQARESAVITVRNASDSASSTGVPAVGFASLSARAHLGSHKSLGHTRRVRL
jgi:hypothetical protein